MLLKLTAMILDALEADSVVYVGVFAFRQNSNKKAPFKILKKSFKIS